MKKKIIAVTVLAAAIAATAALSGCNVSTNSTYDMEQIVAEVDITASDSFADCEVSEYGAAVTSSTGIIKRDLVAYFLNLGYSYISSGYSYEDTFNMLLDALVENAVLTQYSTMYLLKDMVEDGTYANADAAVNAYLAAGKGEGLTESQAKVARYTWLLGEDSDEVKEAWYTVLESLNSAIDNYETSLLKSETSTSGTDTRSTPGNVDTEKDDYYPSVYDEDGNVIIDDLTDLQAEKYEYGVYYNVYTGNDPYMLDASGTYQEDRSDLLKHQSTRTTRYKAYSTFVGNLMLNGLVSEDEDLSDILSFDYIQTEFATQLEQQIIIKYQDEYNDEQEEILRSDDWEESYVYEVYQDLLEAQSEDYEDVDNFTSAISSMSSSSFLLYAPDTSDPDDLNYGTYGFVYNILLPYSEKQSADLSKLQSDCTSKETNDALTYTPEYYTKRNELLRNITTTDQRSAWFNGATEYAFDAANETDDGYGWTGSTEFGSDFYTHNSGWLFFENNLTNTERYEPLAKYTGKYAYNGVVTPTENDDYILIPEELTIDDMLDEFCSYINWVLGEDDAASYETTDDYYKTYTYDNLLKLDDGQTADDVAPKDREIDWSNFVYAKGSVDLQATEADNRQNVLTTGRDSDGNTVGEASREYEVLSAVNELQYAYTTDTSVLSQYLGYSVAVGDDTGYIKEFEYAAQDAIASGSGTFEVCAGDYGWHLLYVTFTFDNLGGEQYENLNWSENFDKEGTFEYYFYEYVKSNDLGTISTTRRSYLLTLFNNDDTVTKYEKRYQDLLDLDSDS